jgi:hypothetical protein
MGTLLTIARSFPPAQVFQLESRPRIQPYRREELLVGEAEGHPAIDVFFGDDSDRRRMRSCLE